MPVQQVTRGYSQHQDRSYYLYAGVGNEGNIDIIETEEYITARSTLSITGQ
jgi:hypothetical protein